ncbi:hypothetical protein GNX14_24205 [Mesorhizobium japonicum]|uniref:hypothetical protein n=1 Tax=Mesorhizobium TaxID=68287 RepID=UPI000800DC74|nr:MULTISPECIES: hypothetical protein [Mesorhizobium]MUT24271.1 hypothetical protein [Mesorhizobium japonicum]OBQ92021.1 hypothetical protein A9K66_07855 [Mesorhizobium sp. AA23]
MAVNQTIIEAVRVRGADGIGVEYPWDPATWYLIRDDHPFLDILTRGYPARPAHDATISKLSEPCEDGMQWQRWDLSEELSRKRRFGEISAVLKVPKDCMLRCYVIPTALLSYRDVVTMVEDVEAELGLAAAWDILADRPDRSWSRPLDRSRSLTPSETLNLIEEEVRAASSIRRDPFTELGPPSRLYTPLAENALVSQWAMRRSGQLRDLTKVLEGGLEVAKAKSALNNPEKRQERIDAEMDRLNSILLRSGELITLLARFVDDVELGTQIYPSPLFQRDHRLRLLLRVFAPNPSEAIAEIESVRSSYPPLILNHLWELWGVVWIARELRNLGFSGICSVEAIETVKRCSWHLTRDGVTIELDFEAEPAFIDYDHIPPLHERAVPALEWAARHQKIDAERPFLGVELKCSPDYLIRITTPTNKALLVGDACLTSPEHHGKKGDKTASKPYTVEKYRRTIGWAVGDQLIRCHPMGGFVIFPPPAHEWTEFEAMPGASDCMLLSPSPQGDVEASRRLKILLRSIVPELGAPSSTTQ